MAPFKAHPVFYSSLIALGVLTAGLAWLTYSQRSELAKLDRQIAQKKSALDGIARQNPFPSPANLQAVEADLADLEKARGTIRAALRAQGEVADALAAAPVPDSSTAAYFDIASFVERVNTRAGELKIDVTQASPNRYGFSTYASTGPERDYIEPVFRQRQHLEYLLDALLKASPVAITSVQRETPVTAAQEKAAAEALASGNPPPAASANSGEGGADFFSIDARTSARVPGFVKAKAYRLAFRGNTLVLRSLLNELAQFKLPIVVRSVEVEPIAAPASVDGLGGALAGAAANPPTDLFGAPVNPAAGEAAPPPVRPLVEKLDSNFTVTVEFISLVEAPADKSNP